MPGIAARIVSDSGNLPGCPGNGVEANQPIGPAALELILSNSAPIGMVSQKNPGVGNALRPDLRLQLQHGQRQPGVIIMHLRQRTAQQDVVSGEKRLFFRIGENKTGGHGGNIFYFQCFVALLAPEPVQVLYSRKPIPNDKHQQNAQLRRKSRQVFSSAPSASSYFRLAGDGKEVLPVPDVDSRMRIGLGKRNLHDFRKFSHFFKVTGRRHAARFSVPPAAIPTRQSEAEILQTRIDLQITHLLRRDRSAQAADEIGNGIGSCRRVAQIIAGLYKTGRAGL